MAKRHFPGYDELLVLAHQATRIMRDKFLSSLDGMERDWKPDHTPVTEADRLINENVIRFFRDRYPHITVIGEEQSQIVEGSEYVVILDPVEGTIPFSHGLPLSTFCIVLFKNGKLVMAMINDPFSGRCWFAAKDRGSFLNTRQISTSATKVLAQSVFSMCWWGGTKWNLDQVSSKLGEQRAIWMNLCTIGISGGLVASGQFAGSLFAGTKRWETPAMQLIVEEAGGVATDLLGNEFVYDPMNLENPIKGHLITCNRHIHEQVLNIIREVNQPE